MGYLIFFNRVEHYFDKTRRTYIMKKRIIQGFPEFFISAQDLNDIELTVTVTRFTFLTKATVGSCSASRSAGSGSEIGMVSAERFISTNLFAMEQSGRLVIYIA